MHYQVHGLTVYCTGSEKQVQPELPTLVFIHGAHNDHSVWNQQSGYFAAHDFNVLAIDLPGHGLSAGPALTSIEAMSHWLLALLDTAAINKASLIGHSMGSLIAIETARCAPERVVKLALLGNAYPMKVADALLAIARDDEPSAIDLVVNWSHLSTPDTVSALPDQARHLMQRLSAINPAQLLHTDLSACNNYRLGEQAASNINAAACPTLFVLAKQDRMTPLKASAQLRSAITHAQVIEIDQSGHSMMTEQPEAVLAALSQFLTKF